MRDFRINWAVILALVVLFGFTYFSFMGVLYNNHVDGDLVKGSLYALGVILIVSLCVVVMCVSRATRWKEIGMAGQIFFAVIILVVFGFSAVPFTGFMRAIESKEMIQTTINQTKWAADSIDQRYNAYVEQRINAYETWLRADSLRLENAGGSTTEVKIANMKTSLENHLKPQSLVICQKDRKEWLSKIEGMSVWNIMLPKNLEILAAAANGWTDEYVKLSNISFDGNPPTLFAYNRCDDNPLEELGESHISLFAVVMALFAFFFMLLPYIVTEPSYATRTSEKSKKGRKENNNNDIDEEEIDYI